MDQNHQPQQHGRISGAQQHPDGPAFDRPAQDRELHGNGVLGLVRLSQEGLVDLRDQTLDYVGHTKEQNGPGWGGRVQPHQLCCDGGYDSAEDDAAEKLLALEPSWGASLYIPQLAACTPLSNPINKPAPSVLMVISLWRGLVGGFDQLEVAPRESEGHLGFPVLPEAADEVGEHRAVAPDVGESGE